MEYVSLKIVVVQAGEIALKFEPDRAQKVVQHVGPQLVEIGRFNPVSWHLTTFYSKCLESFHFNCYL